MIEGIRLQKLVVVAGSGFPKQICQLCTQRLTDPHAKLHGSGPRLEGADIISICAKCVKEGGFEIEPGEHEDE